MARMTRRGALKFASTAGLGMAMAVGQAQGVEPESEKKDGKPVLFAVGPFALGDWCLKQQDQKHIERLWDIFENGRSPAKDDIVKALNECRLYLVNLRVGDSLKNFRFTDDSDGYPKTALEGKLFHKLPDQAGNDFTIRIEGANLGSSIRKKDSISIRLSLIVELRFRGSSGLIGREVGYNVLLKGFSYDAAGDRK